MRNSTVPAPYPAVTTRLSTVVPVPCTAPSAPRTTGGPVVTSDSGLLSLFPVHVDNAQELRLAAETQEWRLYLCSLADGDSTLQRATRAARSLWEAIRTRHPRVTTLPVTTVIEDGIQLAWRSRGGKYIDVEISRDGRFEWLYRDSRQDQTRFGGPAIELEADFYHYLTKLFVG